MKEHLSAFIFELAKDFEISSQNDREFSDEALRLFKKAYLKRAAIRDQALSQYLSANPILFRSYLPHTGQAFRITAELIWCYDEIIIDDPLSYLLTFPQPPGKEELKQEIKNILRLLEKFKESIEEGFLFLTSQRNLIHPAHKLDKETISKTIFEPSVFEILSGDIIFDINNLQVKFLNDQYPPITTEPRLHAEFRGLNSYTKFEDKTDIEAVKQKIIQEIARNKFPEVINEFYDFLQTSRQLNTSILLHRPEEISILNSLGSSLLDNGKQNYNDTALKLLLPYVLEIPPEYLMRIRHKLPTIFSDFRATITEIILSAVKESPGESQEVIKHKIDSQIQNSLMKLDNEMKISLRQFHLKGLAMPVLSGIASWQIGATLNLPSLITGALGTAATALGPIVDYYQTLMKARTDSLYFLWKARRDNN